MAMKIISLKRDTPSDMEVRPSDYPYGLCLHICGDDIDKLGLKKMPGIGEVVQIAGAAVVVALRNASEWDRSMELQITDLGIDTGAKTAAGKMYPSADED